MKPISIEEKAEQLKHAIWTRIAELTKLREKLEQIRQAVYSNDEH